MRGLVPLIDLNTIDRPNGQGNAMVKVNSKGMHIMPFMEVMQCNESD